jgi:hypothetical protein
MPMLKWPRCCTCCTFLLCSNKFAAQCRAPRNSIRKWLHHPPQAPSRRVNFLNSQSPHIREHSRHLDIAERRKRFHLAFGVWRVMVVSNKEVSIMNHISCRVNWPSITWIFHRPIYLCWTKGHFWLFRMTLCWALTISYGQQMDRREGHHPIPVVLRSRCREYLKSGVELGNGLSS